MLKNKILKRIGAGLMAGLCAFTMIGSTVGNMCSLISAKAESTAEPLLSGDDVIRQAVTYLGVPYGWDCKGYDGVYSSDNPTKQSMETVREKGLDCSGLVYATLTDLGVKTTGFPSNNPVPLNYWEYADGSAYTNCTMTYKGVTSPIEVIYDKLDADENNYFDSEKLIPGSVVSALAKDDGVGHMWIYMGQFESRNAVLDYLEKLGYDRNTVSSYVGSGNGAGGKHWRIESNGSEGCVINNNTDGKASLASFVAYKMTSAEADFSIKKCIDGTTHIVGKSSVDGSSAKYGVYSDSQCKNKVAEITIGADGTGSVKLKNGTYYAKEISAPTGYEISNKVYELKSNQMVTVYEDFKRGSIKINKTAEDDVIKDVEFKAVGSDGSEYTAKTDENGKSEFSGLKVYDMNTGQPIEYTVSEVNTAERYEIPKVQKVTLVGGNIDLTADVSFTNELKKGAIKINKQSEDNENGDRTFEISGNGKIYTVKTNADGVAILSDIPVFDSSNNRIVYTISEKDVPIKYVIPANQTVTLTADKTTEVTFENMLKKFSVEAVKRDSEIQTAQGNSTLSGAVYGIYNKGELIDTYTTDSDGYFKTKEYICGDSWTIREISASEGYLIDESIYEVGAEPENYTIESNILPETVLYEDVIKGKIAITKYIGDDGSETERKPESGAEFEIYLKSSGSFVLASDTEKDYLVCDENGYSESKMLPYGIYTVHQTKGDESADFVEDFDVIINENEKTYTYILTDIVKKSKVKIVKKDAETDNIIPASGIGFKVWDCENQCYVEQFSENVFYTDESGTLMLPEELSYGIYELHEVQTATGYFLGSEVVEFNVDGEEEMITVEKYNMPQKGKISIKKTGDTFSSVTALGSPVYTDENGVVHEEGNTIYTPVFEEKGLSNAVYQVIANEDIVTADGTVRAESGDIVAELVTDENGYAETDLLYLGKYEIREVSAPSGYVLNSEPQFVELTYAGQEIEVRDTVNTKFENEYQGIEISLEKIMESDEMFEINGEDNYKSVRFGLFADERIIAENGSEIPENGLVAEVSLNENMKAVITEKIPFGRYYVQEISTDEKYVLNGEKYLVNFEYQGQEMTTVYVDCGQFVNDLKRGTVKGLKVNEADEALENAVFGLFSADCTEFTEDNAILTEISDYEGYFEFENIPFGQYIIREIKSPEGYVLSDKLYPIVIAEDGENIEITAINEKIKGNVTVTKFDAEYPENRLSGAEFTVYSDEKCENKIDVLTETEKGIYMLSELEYGQYFLKETVAPEGFVIDENVYPFSIEKDGETVEISNIEVGKGFINTPEEGSVEITKTDISTGELIPDCGIEILDRDGKVIYQGRTDENGVVKFEKLRSGYYFYHEFDAPDGYIIDENKYPFTIKENGEIVKCQMTNTKIPEKTPPYTGDDSDNLIAWIMILSGISLISIMGIHKKLSLKGGQSEK